MKIPLERSYAILIATLAIWVASLTLILIPTIGLTTPVYPPRPSYAYQLTLLVVTAAIASAFSMYLGIKHLFPDGLKIRERLRSLTDKKNINASRNSTKD